VSVRRLAPAEIQPKSFAFNAANEAWVERQLAKYPAGRQASAVIPLLWRAQEQEGWVSEAAIQAIADKLSMPKIRVLEVATFYTMFNLEPVGRYFVQLCGTVPCHVRGAEDLKQVCKAHIGPERNVTADGALSWLEVECLGACVNAPMVQINADYYEDLSPDRFAWILAELRAGRVPPPGPQNGRQLSAPEGGETTLTDPAIFNTSPRVNRDAPQPADALTDLGAKKPSIEGSQREQPAPSAAIAAVAKAEGKSAGDAASVPPAAPAEPAEQPVSDAWKPELLTAARAGQGDDLKLIKGVGPKLEALLHSLGVYHFDQIAAWSDENLRWIDAHLEGFKGRARRDEWIGQAKRLAAGWRPDASTATPAGPTVS
jgi:NADH-quinone oxidoreductase subunit E